MLCLGGFEVYSRWVPPFINHIQFTSALLLNFRLLLCNV